MSLALFDPISSETKAPLDAIAIELRERLPWLWNEGFALSRIEGYQPGMFGCRAGFHDSLNAYNALHEISHAIELVGSEPTMWKRRLGQPNFGMRIRSYQTIAGERYYEAVTMQATERECRTGAIQLHLLKAGGYTNREFTSNFVRVLKYMADSCFGGNSILNANDPSKYTKGQKEWVNTRKELLLSAYKKYSIEDIEHTWKDICNHLTKKDFELPAIMDVHRP